MAATANTVSTDEYLRTSYEHDPELIDGLLKQRPMPTELHAYVQMLLGHWVLLHMSEWGVMPLSEVRTAVRSGSFRLPDVAVTYVRPLSSSPLTNAPLIAIEILSPNDSFLDLRARAADLTAMGTRHVWLLDPEQRTAFVWSRETWMPAEQLTVPETPVHLDLSWLWSKLNNPENEAA